MLKGKKTLTTILVITSIFVLFYGLIRILIYKKVLNETSFWTNFKSYGLIRILIYKKVLNETSFWTSFKSYGLDIIILVGIALLTTYLILKFTEKKDDSVKIPIDSDIAVKLWREKFILETKIPYFIDYQKDKFKVQPAKEDYLDIQNEWEFFDKNTGNKFTSFEALATIGTKRGLNIVLFRSDLGEPHITNNWNSHIVEHKSWENFVFPKDKPISSPQDEQMRIEMRKIQLLEEGYSASELQSLDQMKPQQKQQPQEDDELIQIQKEAQMIENTRKREKLLKRSENE